MKKLEEDETIKDKGEQTRAANCTLPKKDKNVQKMPKTFQKNTKTYQKPTKRIPKHTKTLFCHSPTLKNLQKIIPGPL